MKNSHKNYPRDVLMNLLVIIGLYVSVVVFLQLIFAYINEALPDLLNRYYDVGQAIRWPLSVLIIVFPLYVFISRFLHRDLIKNPEKNDLRLRRWLTYITIFASGSLIAGDLIALVFNFLQGELTWRFILKVLAVLFTASAVFLYYLYTLRNKPQPFSGGIKIFVWATIVVVLATIVYGFVLAGSPFKQRLVRFDERKVDDLMQIQSYIVNYWQQKEELPETLSDLEDSISGFIPPVDSQSGEEYGYNILGDLSFELCAEFNLELGGILGENIHRSIQPPVLLEAPRLVKSLGGFEESWTHTAGHVCFERNIDPELYKLFED